MGLTPGLIGMLKPGLARNPGGSIPGGRLPGGTPGRVVGGKPGGSGIPGYHITPVGIMKPGSTPGIIIGRMPVV